jgi:hypothetical protein
VYRDSFTFIGKGNVTAFQPLDITDSIVYVVLYWFETWLLTIIEKHRFRVFGNRLPRQYLNPRGRKGQENGEKCIMCTFRRILLG